MLQSLADEQQIRLCEDRSANFRGTGRFQLDILDFENSQPVATPDNVVRLRKIFRTEGCLPLEPENRIAAIISEELLEAVLNVSAITNEQLLENPNGLPPILILPPGRRMRCLEGRSRVEAAKRVLLPGNKQWAVDLYLEDSSVELKRILTEQYTKQRVYNDLEVYHNIHDYHAKGNVFAEGRWRARLSPNKQRNLKQFMKHDMLSSALNEVLTIPGQRFGVTLSMCHEIITMRCDEEFVHYFRHIVNVWSAILDGDEHLMQMTDKATVEALQLRVPGRSKEDYEVIKPLMDDGTLFASVKDIRHRRHIWENITKVWTLIPSLYSLAEDKKFLNPLAKILKKLFPVDPDQTLRSAMTEHFTGSQRNDRIHVQTSESSAQLCAGNMAQRLHWSILQLFLFAGREFVSLLPETPLKERGRPKPVPKQPDVYTWAALAHLAYDLGFDSEEISGLRTSDPDEETAAAFMLQARKPPLYNYEESQFRRNKSKIREILRTATKSSQPPSIPTLFVERTGEKLERRCGRHWEFAYQSDRDHTFLPVFWNMDEASGYGVSSLFVRIAVYKAFFGDIIFSDTPSMSPMLFAAESLQIDQELASEMSLDVFENDPLSGSGEEGRLELLQGDMRRSQMEAEQLRLVVQEERATAEAKLAEEKKVCEHLDRQLQGSRSMNESLTEARDTYKHRLLQMESDLDQCMQQARTTEFTLRRELEGLRDQSNTHRNEAGALEVSLSETRSALGDRTAQQLRSRSNELETENFELHERLQKVTSELEMKGVQQLDVDEDNVHIAQEIAAELSSIAQEMAQTRQGLPWSESQVNDTRHGDVDSAPQSSENNTIAAGHLQLTKIGVHTGAGSLPSHATERVSLLQESLQQTVEAETSISREWNLVKLGIGALIRSRETIEQNAKDSRQAQERKCQEHTKTFQTEKAEWKTTADETRFEIDQVRQERNALQKDVKVLTERVGEKQGQLTSAEQTYGEMQQELTELRAQLQHLDSKSLQTQPPPGAVRDQELRDRRKVRTRSRMVEALREKTSESVPSVKEEATPVAAESSSNVEDKADAILHFKVENNPRAARDLKLNRSKLEDILNRCKKMDLIPYDTDFKAMNPEDAWDIVTANTTYTVVLHLSENSNMHAGLLKQRKRRKVGDSPDESGARVESESELGWGKRSRNTFEMLQYILDSV